MAAGGMAGPAGPLRLLALAAAAALLPPPPPAAARRPPVRCAPPCSCWRESALCVGAAGPPRSLPADLGSLSLVNGTFSEVKDRMFSHLPSLQLLLLNSNSFTVIRDDAFAGLFHLEYLSPFFLLKKVLALVPGCPHFILQRTAISLCYRK